MVAALQPLVGQQRQHPIATKALRPLLSLLCSTAPPRPGPLTTCTSVDMPSKGSPNGMASAGLPTCLGAARHNSAAGTGPAPAAPAADWPRGSPDRSPRRSRRPPRSPRVEVDGQGGTGDAPAARQLVTGRGGAASPMAWPQKAASGPAQHHFPLQHSISPLTRRLPSTSQAPALPPPARAALPSPPHLHTTMRAVLALLLLSAACMASAYKITLNT